MSAATLEASPSVVAVSSATSTTASHKIPEALQQLLHKIEAQCNMNLRISEDLYSLQADLESKWRIAASEGHTTSTTLYEILEYGWKEWRRITV
jgi:hypothetical protein